MPLVPAYRCSHSGKYYPADYVREWGRKYGHGLGPTPVSECLNTDDLQSTVGDGPLAMRPVGVTRAQVDFVMVEEQEYNNNLLIPAATDPSCIKRSEIIRAKQLTRGGV